MRRSAPRSLAVALAVFLVPVSALLARGTSAELPVNGPQAAARIGHYLAPGATAPRTDSLRRQVPLAPAELTRLLFPQVSGYAAAGAAAAAAAEGPPGSPADWILTFNDEFDGTALDLTKWDTKYPDGSRTNNDELEWYVDDAAIVSGGTLKLVATKASVQPGFPYTSGMITSAFSFAQEYGYFEARMKIPAGQGFWPAFWLLPVPLNWPPEIDVMENLGNAPGTVYFTNHWSVSFPQPGPPQAGQNGGVYSGPDLSTAFHNYGVEWTPTAVIWYLDGVERSRVIQYIPTAGHGVTGMHVLANLAVGGSWPGPPNGSTVFPSQLEIDYIRVYSRVPDTTPPTVSLTSPANNAIVSGTVSVAANAADNVGAAGVQFMLDGTNLGAEAISAPFSVLWKTTAASNGLHTLTAVARDAAGNTTTSTAINVTVNNTVDTVPPTVLITAPANNAFVSRTVTVAAKASDNVGVAGVRFMQDGVNLGAEDTVPPYTLLWNTAAASVGRHTLTARARDAAGNATTSSAIVVNVRR